MSPVKYVLMGQSRVRIMCNVSDVELVSIDRKDRVDARSVLLGWSRYRINLRAVCVELDGRVAVQEECVSHVGVECNPAVIVQYAFRARVGHITRCPAVSVFDVHLDMCHRRIGRDAMQMRRREMEEDQCRVEQVMFRSANLDGNRV
jgi:hypothetical protein